MAVRKEREEGVEGYREGERSEVREKEREDENWEKESGEVEKGM